MDSIAFSPDNKHTYFSLQQKGIILDITREDGYAFGDQVLDISIINGKATRIKFLLYFKSK